MLKPNSTDPNYDAELKRWKNDKGSFGEDIKPIPQEPPRILANSHTLAADVKQPVTKKEAQKQEAQQLADMKAWAEKTITEVSEEDIIKNLPQLTDKVALTMLLEAEVAGQGRTTVIDAINNQLGEE
jgi:hypothetical protein